MIVAPSRRRWFQFGVVTMLLLVAAVAVFLAYHVNWIDQRHEFSERQYVKLQRIRWDDDPPNLGETPGVLWLFGEKGRESLSILVDAASWESLNDDDRNRASEARRLFPEARVWFYYDKGGDPSRNWGAPADWFDTPSMSTPHPASAGKKD